MNKVLNTRPPGWFWVASVLLLIWNGLGGGIYLLLNTASVSELASTYSDVILEAMAIAADAPAAFAIAIATGLLGSLLLLARNGHARLFFLASLFAVFVQYFWAFALDGYLGAVSAGAIVLSLLGVVICVFQLWLSGKGIARGWLR